MSIIIGSGFFMCFKRKNDGPVRLYKKEPSTLDVYLELFKYLSKKPEFWFYAGIVLILVLAIVFCWFESIPYFVYNNGGIKV